MLSWNQTRNGLAVTGLGHQGLLALPMTAFFASRQCPGTAIRAAMDWALQQARAQAVVVSGFHSPLEQSVLKVLIEARSPVIAVLARPVMEARLPPDWAASLAEGRMAVVSFTAATVITRLTSEAATARNAQVAQLAGRIVVAYANPGGTLTELLVRWRSEGRSLMCLSS